MFVPTHTPHLPAETLIPSVRIFGWGIWEAIRSPGWSSQELHPQKKLSFLLSHGRIQMPANQEEGLTRYLDLGFPTSRTVRSKLCSSYPAYVIAIVG